MKQKEIEIPRKFEEIKERELIGITNEFSLIEKLKQININNNHTENSN